VAATTNLLCSIAVPVAINGNDGGICNFELDSLADSHCVRQAGAGGWSWSAVREKYCYLVGGWRLELEDVREKYCSAGG